MSHFKEAKYPKKRIEPIFKFKFGALTDKWFISRWVTQREIPDFTIIEEKLEILFLISQILF